MLAIQNVTLNDMAQLAKLCMSISTKGSLHQKGHDLTDCDRFNLQQRVSQLLYLKKFNRWQRYSHVHCIPSLSYKRKVLSEMKLKNISVVKD